MYDFFVSGIPSGQGSKRHVGGGVMIESAKSLPAWRRAVKGAAIKDMLGANHDQI